MEELSSPLLLCSPHPPAQVQEPGWGVHQLQEAAQEEEQHHHHHHHHPQKDPEAAVPTDHRLKEESEEEQQVVWDLHLAGFVRQKGITPTQWTTFMRQL